MSLRSKAKAAKKRDQLKQQRIAEVAKVNARVTELKTRTAGFARSKRTPEQELAYERSKIPQYVNKRPGVVAHAGDLSERFDMRLRSKPVVMGDLTDELAQRQADAVERAKEYKSRVGPAYNKGPTVLLSEGEIAAEKRGELRRRS